MANDLGRFSGNPHTEWLSTGGPDRRMRLLEPFWYDDPDGRRWAAPEGSTVDGASVPAPLWSIVGSPYTGDYRCASIVHDVACGEATTANERKTADRMFYFACRCGGCSEAYARVLYIGVRIGAWVPGVHYWHAALTALPAERRRRTELSLEDVELATRSIQGTFFEIRADVEDQGADAPFEELYAIVEAHLKAKARQSQLLARIPKPAARHA